ncbi:hypothetical protein TWF718_010133 [Orbilia javanica]|uniref:Ubiquitin-like domain-containing protein n=1 Tax=Orbilia javanica TaxID=47235 RepID=A0AAN8MJ82_9PEZI
MSSSQPVRKKPVMKPMFFKKAVLPKPAVTEPTESSKSVPELVKEPSTLIDLISPTASQGNTVAGLQGPKDEGKRREVNDLDFWGRAKDVHIGMRTVSGVKRQKEAEARRQKQKTKAPLKEKKVEPTRSSKRRKSDDKTAILISDDDNDDEKDSDPLPRKNRRDKTLTPRTSAEPIDPSDFDRAFEALKKTRAEVAARPRALSPPLSTKLLASQPESSAGPADASKEIVIQILIISEIPGTKPMVFNRRFTQTLGKVRDTWARMQGFTEDQIERLILVWQNDTRVFDSTLPRSLGIRFDKDGKMYLGMKGKDSSYKLERDEREALQKGIKPGECKIFFRAMWHEEYDDLIKQKEVAKEREKAIELLSDHEEEEVVTGIALNAQTMEITLRGKHFEELKLMVKPSMKISEVIERMRDERKLDEDTEVELHFDGEELEEDMTLQEADIEDEFQIDVVLR